MNHYAAARAAYNETNVLTATPERLVVMLYDGAIRYLYAAAAAAREGRRDVARDRLRRAQAIIDELNRSLDMRQGAIARNLRDLYGFCSRHLIDSTLNGNAVGYEEVAKLLAELREAWDQCGALEVAGA
ncbi:MAG TPA: flagellar export chaperone FliS [Gaiellaceae bacterium]|jgi:flagellar protein FliS|nr:flagellar export chaperone FliS [Gaiellaceae bacterium]